MSQCVFCQIIEGQLDDSRVYEDDDCIAIMDIHPLGNGHVIVIPKYHHQHITAFSPKLGDHLFHTAQRILRAQRTVGWGLQGTHILLNDGPAANQTVSHCHIHIIPRQRGDALRSMGRLALHVTGLFGPKAARKKLDRQARALRGALSDLEPAEEAEG
ncbi:HIT family protein [Tamilnaduibacter salinus]|uniref:HIT family protein n=1 Tax=Tamilnaduibacter salinus TaxID=1484056 RepID=UPI001D179B24|nr:HIT family protein [Tamilnaduibacter salinus]